MSSLIDPDRMQRAIKFAVALLALTAMAGCENALVGRPSLQVDNDEIVAEVSGLDTRLGEIHLRPNTGPRRVVRYNENTRMLYRGREFSISQLQVGDRVALRLLPDSRGGFYASLVRVQESVRDRDLTWPGPANRIVEGTVEHVDRQHGIFQMRERSGARITVGLPYNARRSDIDRIERLRSGDDVRIEGQFLNPDRLELKAFL